MHSVYLTVHINKVNRAHYTLYGTVIEDTSVVQDTVLVQRLDIHYVGLKCYVILCKGGTLCAIDDQ